MKPLRENTRAEKCRLIVFGILVSALILQGLPLGLVTYTEFALGEATSRIVNTYSYFNIQENAHYFYIPLLTSVATLVAAARILLSLLKKEKPQKHRLDVVCLLISVVCAVATFSMSQRVVSGVIAGLLILAVVAYTIRGKIKR